MAVKTVVKAIGTSKVFTTIQSWNDGAPTNLTTAQQSACGTFAVAAFQQGEALTFVGSGATGKFLDTDSTGVGTGTFIVYGILTGTPALNDVITGGTSLATATITNGTASFTGIIWQGQCTDQEFSSATALLTTGTPTTSVTAYKELTTQALCSFIDHPNVSTNPLRYDGATGAAINLTGSGTTAIVIQENNFHISKLQITTSAEFSRCVNFGGTLGVMSQCVCVGGVTAVGTSNATFLIGAGATPTIKNSLIIHKGSGADHVVSTQTGSPKFYNCTIVAAAYLTVAPTTLIVSGASGTVTIQNCGLFSGDSTKALTSGSATFNCTTCVSDIAGTTGVTQVAYSGEYVNNELPLPDFRLSRTSLQIDTGTTDSTNAATDIIGTARPQQAAYDMGAWESPYTTSSNSNTPTNQRIRRERGHDAIHKRKRKSRY